MGRKAEENVAQHFFDSLEDAQKRQTEFATGDPPAKRTVYSATLPDGSEKFIVAQSAARARGHLATFLKLDVKKVTAKKTTRAAKSLTERFRKMSPEEIADARKMLDALAAQS